MYPRHITVITSNKIYKKYKQVRPRLLYNPKKLGCRAQHLYNSDYKFKIKTTIGVFMKLHQVGSSRHHRTSQVNAFITAYHKSHASNTNSKKYIISSKRKF